MRYSDCKVKEHVVLVEGVYSTQQNEYNKLAECMLGYQAPLIMCNPYTSCFAYMFANKKNAQQFQHCISTHHTTITKINTGCVGFIETLSQQMTSFVPDLRILV